MGRMRKMEAKRVLDGEVAALGLSFAAFEVRDGVRPGANDLAWWHEHIPPAERSETKYNLAHLRAYVRIAGADVLPAGGVPLERQRLWMDRSVVSRATRRLVVVVVTASTVDRLWLYQTGVSKLRPRYWQAAVAWL